jgi:hypothetical protein
VAIGAADWTGKPAPQFRAAGPDADGPASAAGWPEKKPVSPPASGGGLAKLGVAGAVVKVVCDPAGLWIGVWTEAAWNTAANAGIPLPVGSASPAGILATGGTAWEGAKDGSRLTMSWKSVRSRHKR